LRELIEADEEAVEDELATEREWLAKRRRV